MHTHSLLEYGASHYPLTDRPSSTHAVNLHAFFCMFISLFPSFPHSTMSRLHFALLSPFCSERQEYILIFFKERGNRKDGRIFFPPVIFIISILLYCVLFLFFFTVPFCFSDHRNSAGFEPESIIFKVPPFFQWEELPSFLLISYLYLSYTQ